MNNSISNKDKKDWENFLSSKEPIPNKDSKLNKNKIPKSITCDLHGYSLAEANVKIKDLIIGSFENHINKLIIVTGKGLHSTNEKDPYVSKNLGILRYSVPEFIMSNKELMEFIIEIKEASIQDGGSGSFYVYLKKKL